MYSTLEYIIIFLTNFTRLSLSLAFYSKKIQTYKLRLNNISKPHIYFTFLWNIRFALSCFLSLIIAASQLISFPIGTKTLQFPMWIFISEYLVDQKSYSGIFRSKVACASLKLIAACHALLHIFKLSHPPNGVCGNLPMHVNINKMLTFTQNIFVAELH